MAVDHIIIKIHGRVQGVFFRASTKDKADELGLAGFVRNDPDGSVYIEVEGDEEIIDQFIGWCSKGPELAKVERISVSQGDRKGFDGFTVKR